MKIKGIKKQTDNRFLNMYEFEIETKSGKEGKYFVASRAKEIKDLKVKRSKNKADAVIIYALKNDEKEEKVVLVKQYRVAIGDYIYEMPAGLVDVGESFEDAGVREMREETGLDFTLLKVPTMFTRPYFTSVGMSDEACGTVYGYANGTPSKELQEDTEEIEIVLANRKEVKRILEKENVSIRAAYMLMHFLNAEDGKVFEFLER